MEKRTEKECVEIIRPWMPGQYKIRYALFDFDGTLSLIREGWQDIMIPYFSEVIRETKTEESDGEIRKCVRDFVDMLTGKQTIYQCIQLNEEVVKRGGKNQDPIIYKNEYLRRLELRIRSRKEDLASRKANPDDYMVPGVRYFIDILQRRGIRCYLASGTDEKDVLYEAKLLGLENTFEGGIHGARDAKVLQCSKELVIRDMIEREKIRPDELVSFGDGYVEVELVANLGGLTVGVATNEASRQGINRWKRERLIKAGARIVIPDFRAAEETADIIGR